jgi:hypothetical protein
MDAVPGWSTFASALKMNDRQVIAWIILGVISSIVSAFLMAHVLKGLE